MGESRLDAFSRHFLVWIRRWRRRHPDDTIIRTYAPAGVQRAAEKLARELGGDWLRKK